MKAFEALAIVLFVSILLAKFGPDPFTAGSTATPLPAVVKQHVVDGTDAFGCRSRETMDRFRRIVSSNDKEAFRALLMQAYRADECRDMASGTVVSLTDTAVISGLVRIRPQGSADEWWMLSREVAQR